MNAQNASVHIRLWQYEFWLLAISEFLLSMSTCMLLPTLPRWLMADQNLNSTEAGLVMGVYVSQMVLCSTLIIDTCESFQRTEANYASAWFGRLALAIGPVAGLLLLRYADYGTVFLTAAACSVASMVLVLMVKFPFRSPEDDITLASLDRFFLPHGFPLMLNLLLITLAFGLLLSLPLSELFFAMILAGLLLAILCWHFVFRDAELKSEVVSGLFLIGAALLMLITRSTMPVVGYAAPLFIGLGMGLIGSRFLLFFIKLSRHCKRGTSQSTFMLGWESGISVGLGLGLVFFNGRFIVGLLETKTDRI